MKSLAGRAESQGGRRGWSRSRRGNIAVIAAISFFPIVGAIGLGVDYTRLSLVKSEMQRGVDAGALAGARILNASGTNTGDVTGDSLMYFWANYRQSVADATIVGGNPTVSILEPNYDTVKVVANATVPMAFGNFLGLGNKAITVDAKATRAVGGMEVVMVLDNTGSMTFTDGGRTPRITYLKNAAKELVNILYGDLETKELQTCPNGKGNGGCTTDYLLTVGIVPFITTVNIAPSRSGGSSPVVDAKDVKALDWGRNNSWKGCVRARSGDLEDTRADEPPGTYPVKPYIWPDTGDRGANDWKSSTTEQWPTKGSPSGQSAANKSSVGSGSGDEIGPNRGCGEPIMPLQPSKAAALSVIEGLNTGAWTGTAVPIGLSWGWRLLSPNWKSVWAGQSTRLFPGESDESSKRKNVTVTTPSNVPRDYATRNFEKVLVLFTDGENDIGCCMTAYGDSSEWKTTLGAKNADAAKAELDKRTSAMCKAIKDKGIKLYVVLLYPSPPQALLDMYNEKGCASGKSTFFHATKGDQLSGIFSAVGTQLKNLRLVQ